MVQHWQAEGIGTTLVQRLAGRLPGLYIIQTDAKRRTPIPVLAR